MANDEGKKSLLSEAHAMFLPDRTSVSVAARDAGNRPEVARAFGCRVANERSMVTVFLSESRAAKLLQCLRETKGIAVAITRPTTHETLQIKGTVLSIAPVSDQDRAAMAAYRDSLTEEVVSLGYRPEFVHTLLGDGADCVAVTFAPLQLFNQTPGPQAGEKLGV